MHLLFALSLLDFIPDSLLYKGVASAIGAMILWVVGHLVSAANASKKFQALALVAQDFGASLNAGLAAVGVKGLEEIKDPAQRKAVLLQALAAAEASLRAKAPEIEKALGQSLGAVLQGHAKLLSALADGSNVLAAVTANAKQAAPAAAGIARLELLLGLSVVGLPVLLCLLVHRWAHVARCTDRHCRYPHRRGTSPRVKAIGLWRTLQKAAVVAVAISAPAHAQTQPPNSPAAVVVAPARASPPAAAPASSAAASTSKSAAMPPYKASLLLPGLKFPWGGGAPIQVAGGAGGQFVWNFFPVQLAGVGTVPVVSVGGAVIGSVAPPPSATSYNASIGPVVEFLDAFGLSLQVDLVAGGPAGVTGLLPGKVGLPNVAGFLFFDTQILLDAFKSPPAAAPQS